MTAYVQRSFAGGELAPSFYANTNLGKYQTGLRTLRNFMIQRGGGVTNRPGTLFRKEVKDSTVQARLIEFCFSATETYLMEFGNLYIRFYQLGVPVAPTANGGAVAWSALSFPPGTLATYLGNTYYAYVTTGTTNPAATPAEWYLLPNPAIFEIPTPYTTAELPDLQFAQSENVMTFVHPAHVPYELTRQLPPYINNSTAWTMLAVSFVPVTATPVSLAIGAGGVAGPTTYWAVTALQGDPKEESLAVIASAINKVPTAAAPVSLTFSLPGAVAPFLANIYRSTDGATYGYVGSSSDGGSFSDVGTIPDFLHSFPTGRSVFNGTDKYPAAVTYYQQRRLFGRSNLLPETVWASRTAQPRNFGVTFPLLDDDAVTFKMMGKKVNPVKHLLDLGRLIVLTEREEKLVEGDDAGILRPDAVNPRKISSNGCNKLRPIELDDSALYVQARGTKVRDLQPVKADSYFGSYQGTDLTIYAQHLFDGYTLVDWDFAQNPHSVVWAARSDGVLLGLTYLRDQEVWGWHRHDTDGAVENVCVVTEGANDTVYLIVKRTINGVIKRYIESMSLRYVTDQATMNFMDCALVSNGWNTTATTVILSGGTNYDDTENLTLGASAGIWSASDVGNALILQQLDANGVEVSRVRATISAWLGNPANVQAHVDKIVPVALRNTAKTTWAMVRKVVTGLSHLEGKTVSVMGDGYVVASPNNADYPVLTVTGGQITMPAPYAIVTVGLPFISDFQPLDLDTPGPSTIKDKKVIVTRVGLYLEASRGVWIGQPDGPTAALPLNRLQEVKMRDAESYSTTVTPITDLVVVAIESDWGSGRFLVRQVDPLPITILSATPMGLY